MNHRSLTIARTCSAVGLLSALAYLVWRAVWSIGSAPLLLAVPALALEVGGALGAATLVWALWPGTPPPLRQSDNDDGWPRDVDIVVRVVDQPMTDVRATVLAARSVERSAGLTVLDLDDRPEVRDLAASLGIPYRVAEVGDRNGLRSAAVLHAAPAFVILDAGDIPRVDAIHRLTSFASDPRVAVVQGRCEVYGGDTTENNPDGRHELTFERCSLNPSLGARGMAVFSDAGALVRRDALAAMPIDNDAVIAAQWQTSIELLRAGWRIIAPVDCAVIGRQASRDLAAISVDRVHRAAAARTVVTGRRGALRASGLSRTQRLAFVAWTVRPLSGFRRVLTFAMLIGVLLGGREPFMANAFTVASMWLPSFLLIAVGLSMLSDNALRIGDRTRWSLRYAGVALCSLPPFTGLRDTGPRQTAPPATRLLPAMITAISVVVVMRGVSEQWTHTLGPLRRQSLIAALTCAVWLLLMAMDSLRLLARPLLPRRDFRVGSWQPAALDDQIVFMVDVSARGAGVVVERQVMTGARTVLETTIPTATGCISAALPAVVRNIRPDMSGGWHVGLEFDEPDPEAANALAEFCMIEPARRFLDHAAGSAPGGADLAGLPSPLQARRPALRLAAACAMLGVVASAVPTAVNAEAPTSSSRVHASVSAAADRAAGTPVAGSVTMVLLLLSLTAALAMSLALGVVTPRRSTGH
jgi:hypothetical protein